MEHRKVEIDVRFEAPNDNPTVEVVCGERIDKTDPQATGDELRDHRDILGLQHQSARDLGALKDLVDQVPPGRVARKGNESLMSEVIGRQASGRPR